ncbi:hypothetical protein [Streptomyces peucetius]|uniref:Uncharacterized protein n=1 Tax=Streptomyces peucetius TaxID=1950 RepID=A0ABY6ICQ9_STRPE|nr:hypothetical protein [Streptomyces peucetius]UYQ63742.1 hypothetical protein OGH68_21295 [Streptomyces peucetius]
MTDQEIRAEAAKEPGDDHTWPLVLLLPALLLLRFLGEHAWAYWTAAVAGGLGMMCAAVAVAGAARDLVRGRRPWKAAFALVVLACGAFALVVRLVES